MKPTANHANHAKENFPVRFFRGLISDHTDTQPQPAAGQSALWKYLPKVTAQHSADPQTALDAYKQTKVAQVGGKGNATNLRGKLAATVETLAVRRRQLQHAADGEFQFTDPTSAGMRQKFDLPADRPLNP